MDGRITTQDDEMLDGYMYTFGLTNALLLSRFYGDDAPPPPPTIEERKAIYMIYMTCFFSGTHLDTPFLLLLLLLSSTTL
jgi:hypothetical protein